MQGIASVFLAVAGAVHGGDAELPSTSLVRGITISCQTYGPEWGTDGFGVELDRLRGLGANWVAIHPYARIGGDGSVHARLDPEQPPRWITRPIEEARARGLKILIKPHLAYWGSPFDWRGAIDFPENDARERFFDSYSTWILGLARATRGADAFAVGTELDRLVEHDAEWRRLIAAVREQTDAKLTYAANWPDFERVPFWDALDAIGIQAYFPLVEAADTADVSELVLERGWAAVLPPVRALYERTGKPVVFTELGYTASLDAALRPWEYGRSRASTGETARVLQARCLTVALRVLERERDWLRGAFLWKWFVGPAPGADFVLDTPDLRSVLARSWAGG